MSSRRRRPARIRIGRVSVYLHHNSWWLYYRQQGDVYRSNVGTCQLTAEQQAAQINGQLTLGQPVPAMNRSLDFLQLKQQFLWHHEHVRKSSLSTIRRYRAALEHLVQYTQSFAKSPALHQFPVEAFIRHLRETEVTPNGHPHSRKRRLRDAGIRYILEVCRSLFAFAVQQRLLPPYTTNPFAILPWERLRIEDRKDIFVFDQATECAFWESSDPWAFSIHFVLAKTGMRIGEVQHLLIEDLDLESGWITVRNKLGLGWRVKTGNNRRIPLLTEVVRVLRLAIGTRSKGLVFLRQKYQSGTSPPLVGTLPELEAIYQHRFQQLPSPVSREQGQRLANQIWRDAGMVKAEQIRNSFIRTMRVLGRPEATCPKSWRHTFATLLQDSNVDPLIRQLTLGHRPSLQNGLGMTTHYTHTRPETQRSQIEAALRQWPASLTAAISILEPNHD